MGVVLNEKSSDLDEPIALTPSRTQRSEVPEAITIPDAVMSLNPDQPYLQKIPTNRDRILPHCAAGGEDVEKGLDGKELKEHIIVNQEDSLSRPGSSITEVENPNTVDWDGERDPANPQNWTRKRKWWAIALVSAFTFMSPVASSILAPSLHKIGSDLSISNPSEESLCLSIFVLGFAFGPLLCAPLSEIYGRARVLQGSNLLFIIFNCACGFATTKAQLITFRLLAGLGGSAPLALGSGVLADLFSADERGLAVSIYSFFPILGPAIGPIIGGFITQYTTWRWAFWGTTILDFPILILGTFLLEETYPPVLLIRKKVALAKATGNYDLRTKYEKPNATFRGEMKEAIIRPMKLMTTQIIIFVLGLYQAFLYGLMYIVLVSFPKLWSEQYHETTSIASLNYISLGIGYCAGIQISSLCQDKLYRYLKVRNGGIGLPEFRAPLMIPTAIILPIGLFLYGWTAEYKTHWIFPSIGALLLATGIMIGFNALITYIVDAYPTYSASAVAASSVLRCLAAFVFPLFAPTMYAKLGYGWGNSLLGFVAIGIGGPAPILLWLYGAKLRKASKFASG